VTEVLTDPTLLSSICLLTQRVVRKSGIPEGTEAAVGVFK